MNSGPYRAMNLYIGGSNRSCGNAALNGTLVSQLGRQGWRFVPTWVGPQSMYWGHPTSSRISNDPTTAYNHARSAVSPPNPSRKPAIAGR